jgi:ADP-ribosylglycohydrolase
LNNYIEEAPVASYSKADYERSIVNSSLWAAAGDAIGWMTELSGGVNGVMHRTGHKLVTEPVDWQRRIGGRTGVKVDLPAGTYSDDTQLRLCVSRAIRGNGSFDVEAFAKIEVTTWQGYCLGAGIGSKAAASNLTKRGVNWFSNFFDTDYQRYITGGGNGAAMRIQPHVWAANGTLDEMILRVMRDAIVTHGHPHGFCGAVFHALCLWITLGSRNIPSLDIAKQFISYMDKLPSILEKDNELHAFWKPAWERESGGSLIDAIHIFQKEALHDVLLVEDAFNTSSSPDYHDILNRLGCLTDKYRGSGFKTAFAALVLSILYSSERIEDALIHSANELESDTDTIATMAGAILGSLAEFEPNWQIQDMDYLKSEAQRMVFIAQGVRTSSFSYPDVSVWEPPMNQSDSVVMRKGALALRGIGNLVPLGKEYSSGSSVWQWFQLPFGQSVLAKRRSNTRSSVNENQMPGEPLLSKIKSDSTSMNHEQNSFKFTENKENKNEYHNRGPSLNIPRVETFPGLDEATDVVIASNFDNETIGRVINQCIEATGSIELTVSLSAIIAKARLARQRRKSN